MKFFQDPPRLANQYDDDALLREVLARRLDEATLDGLVPELRHLGALAVELYEQQLQERTVEPELLAWDAWGHRVDRVTVSPLWQRAARLAAEHGLVAVPYEKKHGERSRLVQMALVYLVDASTDVYTCPLAMTDGAARTLVIHQNEQLLLRALPRLTSRDPATAWTSGQWMTERTGGSDVSNTETIARPVGEGGKGGYTLHGVKWFTSAVTSQMTLTLARPEGNPAGSQGLALFYAELRDDAGRLQGITVNRLKDKLGTRKVPTAELTLDGLPAIPVAGLSGGVRNITPMLSVTRLWNAYGAVGGMRRAIALVRDYAKRRRAFGALLADKPLHLDTVAGMVAEQEGAFLLTARMAELLGKEEAGTATPGEEALMRVLTPIVKLTTAKQAVAVASEALECFGGAGYIEDTGLPRILRDAQVLSIWEGTTNVLSLDALRALAKEGTGEAIADEVKRALSTAKDPQLKPCVEAAGRALAHARRWLEESMVEASSGAGGPASAGRLEAGARRFALTVGRALELALLVEHAQWCFDHQKGDRASLAARRLATNGIDLIRDDVDARTRMLALGD